MNDASAKRYLILAVCGAAGTLALNPALSQNVSRAPVAQAQSSAATAGAAKSTEVVARVGGAEVSADELRNFIAGFSLQEQAAFAKDTALLSQAVRQLLVNRLVLDEAVQKKWDQQPGVAAQLGRVRDKALAELYLQSVSTPPGSYPGEEELQKTYDANRGVLIAPRQYQLRQIFVAEPKGGDKAAQTKAKERVDEILRKLKDADFVAVASSGNDAPNGGDLGWVAESQLRPEISGHVTGLAKNSVTDPIRLDDGWHIIKLLDTKPAHPLTLAEVRDQLVQQMRSERAASARRAYLAQLLKQHPPVINELALSKLFDGARK